MDYFLTEKNTLFEKIFVSTFKYQSYSDIIRGHQNLNIFYRIIYGYELIGGRFERHKIQIK